MQCGPTRLHTPAFLACACNGLTASPPALWRIALALALTWVVSCGALAAQPVKLAVKSGSEALRANGSATVTVTLLDANNQPAAAPHAMTVTVSARMPDGSQERHQVSIPAGQTAGSLKLSLPKSGIVDLRASQPELLEGGTFLNVRPVTNHVFLSQPVTRDLAVRREPAPAPAPAPRIGSSAAAALALAPAMIGRAISRPSRPRPAPPAAAAPPVPKPVVTLRYSPQGRALLADGKDSATISAFVLDNQPTTRDIQIRLFNSQGVLTPHPTLVIPRGQDSAQVKLTSQQVGDATVEYMGANPATDLEGERKLSIPFSPPISSLTVTASPPAITLMDQADLVIQLSDAAGRPVATDTARTVSLTLDSGRGVLGAKEITIPAGSSVGRTSFVPTSLGTDRLAAFSPGLMKSTCDIRVSMPFLLIGASALGALAGGLLAFLTDRKRNRWRILIGLITGFLLYLAAAFLNILPEFNLGDFHPFAVLLVSAVGGWLGTKIFDPLVKRLGLAS